MAKLDDSELTKLQEKQRAAVDRVVRNGSDCERGREEVHPDLQDLNFGELGEDKRYANQSVSSIFPQRLNAGKKQRPPTPA